ncbi:Rieske (2Fe-2S) protein [Streptomyces sp. F-1]|uniref:Rieske (2Fe-2S) protein n=1 Tax=Streptomyces sp. F-1 TaxID=463642 RepID=UPI00085C9F32|nr:Rieske (2Fe-2S) protein [Streptomyces sp. F-1]SFY51584.1 Cytochrome b6-f complex iron-sulfur subunit [Streptomyces sp. F-1]
MTQGATRRTVIATGAAALATGCGGNNGGSTSAAADNTRNGTDSPSPTRPASPASPAASTSPAADAKKLASTGDIPEGGGKVFDERKIVVTQPSKGEFKAFSAVCTHMGCTVSRVQNGTIDCPCHGSKFKIADGSVAEGPATKPLEEKRIKVEGNSIQLG